MHALPREEEAHVARAKQANECARIYSRNLCCLHHGWIGRYDRANMGARSSSHPINHARAGAPVRLPDGHVSGPSPRTTHKVARARPILMAPLLRLAGQRRPATYPSAARRGAVIIIYCLAAAPAAAAVASRKVSLRRRAGGQPM